MASPALAQLPPKEPPRASLWEAMQWVQEVLLEAHVLGHAKATAQLLKKAEGMKIDGCEAATSGLTFLLAQPDIWKDLPEWGHVKRRELCQKWKCAQSEGTKARHPMGGRKPAEFCAKVHDMASWRRVALWRQQVALQLVGRGWFA